jgi:heptosyltransferase II
VKRLLVLAPNWLGDAVMALPALADVRRASPGTEITVAARPSIAPLFSLVSEADRRLVIDTRRNLRITAGELATQRFDTTLLLPNSTRAALVVSLARIPQRWGYRANCRGPLLTRAVARPSGLHQAEYYQQLVHALGFPNGPMEPRIAVPPAARAAAAAMLRDSGWDGRSPMVALAPGAAYGAAKRWPPERFAELAASLAADGVQSVMIGTEADAATAGEVTRAFHAIRGVDAAAAVRGSVDGVDGARAVVNAGGRAVAHDFDASNRTILPLVGRTDLPTLAGVLAICRALVTNDSGAMHLAAAVGTSVTAVFGPTDERATRPLGDAHRVLTFPVWCRPCLLRECPLDHRCMRGVDAAAVVAAARRSL